MCEAIRKRGRARSYAHLLSGPCPPLSHHDRHFPSSPFHSRSRPPSLSSPVHDRAPSRRRANDLIREQWLSINNPVSPFTLPGHPPRRGVCQLTADPFFPPTTNANALSDVENRAGYYARNSARKSCLPPPPSTPGISPRSVDGLG